MLAIFVEGHPVTISAKLFRILISGFRIEKIKIFLCHDKPHTLAAMFWMDNIVVVFCLFFLFLFFFFVFVALRPMSTAMVIARRSVHLTTLFPGQA